MRLPVRIRCRRNSAFGTAYRRNADWRQEACNPARDGTRQHDSNQPQYWPDPLQPRDLLAHEAVGEGRGDDRLKPRDARGNSGRYTLTDRGEYAPEAESVHQRACNEAMADLICIRPPCTPCIEFYRSQRELLLMVPIV